MLKALAWLLCAWPILVLAQNQADTARSAAGCGPDEVQFDVKTDKNQHALPSPEPGKALVVVFEDEKTGTSLKIGGVTTRVGLDGKWAGANHAESYFAFPADPGDHRLCVNWQSSLKRFSRLGAATTLTAEAGKVYFYRVEIEERSDHAPAVRLKKVDSAEGQFQIASHALSTSHPKEAAPEGSSN
jgi:hypothetical protein